MMILFSGKNSLPITLNMVYKGTATIIPSIPKIKPAMSIIRNISSGCELTLFEKIMGCETLLSIIWTIQKPIKTYIVVGKISDWKSLPRLLNMVSIAAKTEAISGPMYGIIFNTAHKKAIISALGIPNSNNTIM